jgi:hypothetical protein
MPVCPPQSQALLLLTCLLSHSGVGREGGRGLAAVLASGMLSRLQVMMMMMMMMKKKKKMMMMMMMTTTMTMILVSLVTWTRCACC